MNEAGKEKHWTGMRGLVERASQEDITERKTAEEETEAEQERERRRDRPEFVQLGESVSSGITSQMDRHRQRRGRWMWEDARRVTEGQRERRSRTEEGPAIARPRSFKRSEWQGWKVGEGTQYKNSTTRQWTKQHTTSTEHTRNHRVHQEHKTSPWAQREVGGSWERLRQGLTV